MSESVLITGCEGFVGRYLTQYLFDLGYEISATYFDTNAVENLNFLKDKTTLYKCDITKFDDIKNVIEKSKPDHIYHLAAQSHVPTSWKNPQLTFNVNVIGTLNIINVISELKNKPIMLSVTSAEVYGHVYPAEVPIKEDNPPRPSNPYAISKLTQDQLSTQYAKANNLPIIIVRPFSHTGPHQLPNFVCSAFAKQCAAIQLGLQEPIISVGNLEPSRDFTDVRDMVKAYHLAITKCDYGQCYNICSKSPQKISGILDTLLSFTDKKIEVVIDKEKFRPIEIEMLYGDPTKFISKTGWSPQIPLTTTLKDIFNYWIEKLNP